VTYRTPNEGIALLDRKGTSRISWWLETSPQAFTQRAGQEVPRMSQSKFARTPPHKMVDGND
jgi:hypothetical protein